VAVKVPTENNKEADSNKKKGFFSFKSKKADGNNNNKKKNKTQTKRKIVHKTRTIKKRSLKSISHYFKQVEGMSGKFTQLVPYNNFLLVAGNNGLYAVNGKESENILKNRYIVDIYVSDCCTEAYCCTNNGIYKIFRENNKWKINHFAQTTNALINSIAYDKNKKWVVSYENMLFRGKFNNKKIDILQEIELPEKPGQTFIVKNINDSIMVFTSNKLYHFTDDGKLNVIKEFADDNYIIHNQNIFTWLYNNAQWSLCCKT
jgi:ligand-binding sensor domain-containing protein